MVDWLREEVRDDAERVAVASPRPLGAVLLLAGVVHLLVPMVLLALADRAYDRVLDVDFRPGETTALRVRALGLGMILLGGHLLYHGGIRQSGV